MIDHHAIGRLLLETGRIGKDDYTACVREARRTGKSPQEVLVLSGKLTVDELVEAITIHLDITLLKEALGMKRESHKPIDAARPLGSYLERISLLFKTSLLMSSETNMKSLVEILLREAPSVMNAERATIFLPDYEKQELYSHIGVGLEQGQIRIPWDSGIAGWVFSRGQSLNIPDPYKDPRFNREVDPKTGYRTKNLLCVPLRSPASPTIGVFQVLNKRAGVFTSTDLEILEILASQAARAIEHIMEWDNQRQSAARPGNEGARLTKSLSHTQPLEAILGNAAPMQEIRALIRTVAPTDTTVLVQGESGTGKELLARAIHRLGTRCEGPLITLNCAAVPADLIESELFGHKKGAFTGAIQDYKGVFRAAHGGALFLDEIEATSPAMQVKLLRAIQTREIRPVGDNVTVKVDVRLIAATNQDLGRLVHEGRFREDLFYRMNVFPIVIPPLRNRPEDIPILANHFVEKLCLDTGKRTGGIDSAAMDILVRYRWPGNVRELENEIERAHVLTSEGRSISAGSLSAGIRQAVEDAIRLKADAECQTLKDAIEELEARAIGEALTRAGGNRTAAAAQLGLSRQGLLNKMYRYGLARR